MAPADSLHRRHRVLPVPATMLLALVALSATLLAWTAAPTAFAADVAVETSRAFAADDATAADGDSAADTSAEALAGGTLPVDGVGAAPDVGATISAWWDFTWPGKFWLGIACLFGAFLAAFILRNYVGKFFERLSARTENTIDDRLLDALRVGIRWAALVAGVAFFVRFWAEYFFTISPDLETLWNGAFKTAVYIVVLRFGWALINVLKELLITVTAKTETELDDQLVPLLIKTAKVAFGTLMGLMIAESWGFSVTGIIAGLGVGGLALALAAQESVQNLFGSVIIFTDRPFKVGDYISCGGVSGTVKEVGFRSTRMATVEGTLLTIPNKDIAHQTIENFGGRGFRRYRTKIGLTYDATPEQIEAFIERVQMLLKEQPLVERAPPEPTGDDKAEPLTKAEEAAESARQQKLEAGQKASGGIATDDSDDDVVVATGSDPIVAFEGFGDSALNVLLGYRLVESDNDGRTSAPGYADALATNQRINLGLMRIVRELGLDFAFPSRTVYTRQDGAPPTPATSTSPAASTTFAATASPGNGKKAAAAKAPKEATEKKADSAGGSNGADKKKKATKKKAAKAKGKTAKKTKPKK